jgi:hypothetical protein
MSLNGAAHTPAQTHPLFRISLIHLAIQFRYIHRLQAHEPQMGEYGYRVDHWVVVGLQRVLDNLNPIGVEETVPYSYSNYSVIKDTSLKLFSGNKKAQLCEPGFFDQLG